MNSITSQLNATESLGSASSTVTALPSYSETVLLAPSKKRQRKSRGRGLRTKSGCLTCRSRHKKCDEKLPVCGPCSISTRDCVFPDDKLRALNDAADTLATDNTAFPSSQRVDPVPVVVHEASSTTEALNYGLDFSPGNGSLPSEPWTTNFASTRWLDLLTNDAAQSGFSLPPNLGLNATEDASEAPIHLPPVLLGPGDRELLGPFHSDPQKLISWQLEQDIVLGEYDAALFRHFAQRSALWLDVLDPHKHFSTYAIRLALRNPGLMRAILAVSARHLSLLHSHSRQNSHGAEGSVDDGDINKAMQYYYETLHYVQTALQHNTYTRSEQLLATALVISTYEMLDESDGRGNWQRHLKGVFWIQRSQEVNGGSGGIRQAVWWAWLKQDVWAAFREKRRCFSFWRPVKDYADLSKYELAGRSIYLLSQAVNYCADSIDMEKAHSASYEVTGRRIEMGDKLLAMLERWKSYLGDDFHPLPSPSRPEAVFRPLWVHPPDFAVALQVYSFARILIMLHRPAPSGFNGYLRVQRALSEAVDTICGIAMELKDEGCQILSAQCLYGAGLCVQDNDKRNCIISIMEDCEDRTGWPMLAWREDLRRKWAKADKDYQQTGI